MSGISRLNSSHVNHAAKAAASKPPLWTKGLEKLVKEQGDNLDSYEHVGPNATDPSSAKGKAFVATLPKAVREFFAKQEGALADNDGTAAVLKIPLSEVSPHLKGNAIAVRWTSEDQSLDRLFVFTSSGEPVAKGWTDGKADFKWEPARAPFKIDDSPHK